MAGASMNDIKARMKSVTSTKQITKAMELVATSKLRKAKENAERSRPYYEVLRSAILGIGNSRESGNTVWTDGSRSSDKTLYIVIAGDRGLAGGYNANVFRLVSSISGESDIYLPIGRKAVEYYKNRKSELLSQDFGAVADLGVGPSLNMARLICDEYKSGKFGKVILVYTKFVSMISQTPVYEELLPFSPDAEDEVSDKLLLEEDAEEMLDLIMPQYVGGIIYSAVCEALASESGARRSAMNSANKNAEEIINTLVLKYNRARQAVITQEITEIVSGSEAL